MSKYISLALLIKQTAGVVKNIVYLHSTQMYSQNTTWDELYLTLHLLGNN